MEMLPIPPGNQALAAAISCGNTPHLQEPPSPSPFNHPSPPLTFLVEIFAETRNSLQPSPDHIYDLSPQARQTITAGEGSILSIPHATVSGMVAIPTQLDTVTTQQWDRMEENDDLLTHLNDLSSKVANESVTQDDIGPLISAVRDICYNPLLSG